MMTNINESIVSEAENRNQNLLAEELVGLIETYHPHENPGVSRETVAQYSEALTDGAEDSFDRGAFDETVDSRLTDATAWVDGDTLYTVNDNRISIYPASWHEALAQSTDVREHIRFLRDDAEDFEIFGSRGTGYGIPESELIDIVAVVGQADPNAVKTRIEDLRDRGEIVEGLDQHPDARVRIAENADEIQDPALSK
jgi:hypothetical protein